MVAVGLAWRPGRVTMVVLALAVVLGAWLLSPPWWSRLGQDSVVFYSAATLAADGGNPYDFQALRAQEQLVASQQSAASQGAFSPSPYAYPPLMTSLWQLLLPLGERGFYWANVAILLAAGLVGSRLVLLAVGFQDKRVALAGMAVSAPFILGLVAGNPSNLLLLAWAAGFYAITRGRHVVGGALLALGLLKAPVGLAAAAGLLLVSTAILPAALGFLAGTSLFLALNLLALGPGPMQSWLQSLGGYGASLGAGAASGYQQCCLAGLPGLLADHVPIAVATGVSALVIVAVIAIASSRSWWRRAVANDPLARAALLTSALLAASPYLHLNDLVLEALPLVFVATRHLTPVGRALLVAWGLGVVPPLVVGLALSLWLHGQVVSAAGFGVLLSAATLAAVILAVDPWLQPVSAPSPPEASHRR